MGQQGECLIINSWAHGISCLNPANGATIWEKAVFPRRPVGSPILHDGLIIGNCGEGGGDNSVIALRVNNHQPEVAFKIDKTMAPYVPSIIAQGEYAYLWSDKGSSIASTCPMVKRSGSSGSAATSRARPSSPATS